MPDELYELRLTRQEVYALAFWARVSAEVASQSGRLHPGSYGLTTKGLELIESMSPDDAQDAH